MGEGDGDVGEDDGGVGVDCGDDDGPDCVLAPPEEGGREPPFFFLNLLPRWEKGFPSGPWLPWHGWGKSPSEIGSVSLSLSVSAFSDSALSPFLIFPEIRNTDWAEIWTRFLSGYWLSCGERRARTALRSGHEGQGRTPLAHGPLGHRLALILLPKNHTYSKKNLRQFLSCLDSV